MAIFGFKSIRPALCLGGGGARGYAHIGAIMALEEAGIDFNIIAGTSVGSLIGGLYAAGITGKEMQEFGDKINLKDVHHGFTPNDPLNIGALVKNLVGNIRIEELKRKLFVIAVDLVEAAQVIIDRGLLYEAVSASCAVPIFFRPLIKGNMHLVDGGLLNNIPADVCRMMGATHVVTVDINPTRGSGTDGLGILDVAKGTFNVMTAASSQTGLINSDIIIAPDLSRFRSTKKDGHDEMILLGYNAAREKIPAIRQLLGIRTTYSCRAEKKAAVAQRKQHKAGGNLYRESSFYAAAATTEIPEYDEGITADKTFKEHARLKKKEKKERKSVQKNARK